MRADDEEEDGGNITLGGETEDDTDNFYTPHKIRMSIFK